jgi:XTP/dITP diphosphohydrolase
MLLRQRRHSSAFRGNQEHGNGDMMLLLVATRNPHKLREILEILDLPGIEAVTLKDYPDVPEVIEDGLTFDANAVKKARNTCDATGLWTMADDSGLEVKAIGWRPGVRSARYAGEPTDNRANNAKLLSELEGVRDRRARFRCVIALASPGGQCRTVEGVCAGSIALRPAGDGGFGYDPLFVPEGESVTFAEMPPAAKNLISHRGKALRAAATAWRSILLKGG